MPKIKEEETEEFEEDEEEFDEDELEQEEVQRKPKRKPTAKPSPKNEEPELKQRYGIMAPQPMRLGDTETSEIIGEGEYLVPMALANIIERLERIENSIGSIMGG